MEGGGGVGAQFGDTLVLGLVDWPHPQFITQRSSGPPVLVFFPKIKRANEGFPVFFF